MILQIRQGLQAEGIDIPLARLCRWFSIPGRTLYYRPIKRPQPAAASQHTGLHQPRTL